MNKYNYWLVGSNWSGNDQTEIFIKRGYWEMGWDDDEALKQASKRDQIKEGDRIAIKSMDGKGASTITIKAIGIVKDVADKRIYIDWKLVDINRTVDSKGTFGTIHGPYSFSDNWTNEIFSL